jgi:hypothetical protein
LQVRVLPGAPNPPTVPKIASVVGADLSLVMNEKEPTSEKNADPKTKHSRSTPQRPENIKLDTWRCGFIFSKEHNRTRKPATKKTPILKD